MGLTNRRSDAAGDEFQSLKEVLKDDFEPLVDLAMRLPGATAAAEKDAEKPAERCAVCRSRGDLHRCSGCKAVWYCSSECQRKDWKTGHKKTCQSTAGAKKKTSAGAKTSADAKKKSAGATTGNATDGRQGDKPSVAETQSAFAFRSKFIDQNPFYPIVGGSGKNKKESKKETKKEKKSEKESEKESKCSEWWKTCVVDGVPLSKFETSVTDEMLDRAIAKVKAIDMSKRAS